MAGYVVALGHYRVVRCQKFQELNALPLKAYSAHKGLFWRTYTTTEAARMPGWRKVE